MSIKNLDNIKKIFGGGISTDEQHQLYKEMLFLTLSRATRADLVTEESEVAIVQTILKDLLGEEFSSSDIRVAASSELFEASPIGKYLGKVGSQISSEQGTSIVNALIKVFGADGQVTESEIAFFNLVVDALDLTPAEIVGLEVMKIS